MILLLSEVFFQAVGNFEVIIHKALRINASCKYFYFVAVWEIAGGSFGGGTLVF